MEQMTSKGKAALIEEIMDHDVNDVVGKELDADSGNNVPTTMVYKQMIEDRTSRMSGEFEFRKLLAKIDHEFELENSSQDEQDVSNDVDFDDVIFDDVSFDDIEFDVVDFDVGIDDLNFEQELEEVLYYATYASSINGKSRDVPTWFNLFVVYDQPIDDEGGVVPFEVVPKEMVAEEIVYGGDKDVIPTEVYDAMVVGEDRDVVIPHEVHAIKGFLYTKDGDVMIPTEVYNAMV
ncbi:hypothetical protein Tco_1120792 [Tanacetum coccineum]